MGNRYALLGVSIVHLGVSKYRMMLIFERKARVYDDYIAAQNRLYRLTRPCVQIFLFGRPKSCNVG